MNAQFVPRFLAKTISILTLAYTVAAGLPANSHAFQENPDTHKLETDIKTLVAEKGTGLNGSIVVFHGEKQVFGSAQGLTGNAGDSINVNTRFKIASLSKVFIESAIFKLVDQQKLSLDDSLAKHRPQCILQHAKKITIKQLLVHNAGLPRELDRDILKSGARFDDAGFAGPYFDGSDSVEMIAEPGERTSYSNLGYWYLGTIIESATGKTLPDAMQQLVFEPLKLENSGYVEDDASGQNIASGMVKGPDQKWQENNQSVRFRYASGGMYSSAPDVARLWKSFYAGDFLSKQSKSEWRKMHARPDGSERLRFVGGMLPGYTNCIVATPDGKTIAILLNNRSLENPNEFLALAQQIVRTCGQ